MYTFAALRRTANSGDSMTRATVTSGRQAAAGRGLKNALA